LKKEKESVGCVVLDESRVRKKEMGEMLKRWSPFFFQLCLGEDPPPHGGDGFVPLVHVIGIWAPLYQTTIFQLFVR